MTAGRIAKLLLALGFLLIDWKLRGADAKDGCAEYEVLDNNELPCEIKQEIVKVHNKYRQKLAKGLVKGQPQASNMQEMYWDDELALGAQAWANQCTYEHNPSEERKVERFRVGQNLGISRSTGMKDDQMKPEFPQFIKAWFNEHKQFKFGPIGSAKNVGHYTQVVWAESYLVGCGYIRYKDGEVTNQFYVCNYGPAGNIVKKHPYEVGSPKCSGELVKSKNYNGLCAKNEPPTLECSSKDKPNRRLPPTRKKNKNEEEKEKEKESIDKAVIINNSQPDKLKKLKVNLYNFIMVNVLHL